MPLADETMFQTMDSGQLQRDELPLTSAKHEGEQVILLLAGVRRVSASTLMGLSASSTEPPAFVRDRAPLSTVPDKLRPGSAAGMATSAASQTSVLLVIRDHPYSVACSSSPPPGCRSCLHGPCAARAHKRRAHFSCAPTSFSLPTVATATAATAAM